jgi:transcriptional regulator with XRE-family HTH domain
LIRNARLKPKRLAEKLLQIKCALGLSQTELLHRLDAADVFSYERISKFERGMSEPPLPILLRYARSVNLSANALIDDDLDLPSKLPAPTRNVNKYASITFHADVRSRLPFFIGNTA